MSGKKGSKWGNSAENFLDIISSIPINENGCKLWPLGKDKDGYGYYTIKGKMYRSHRYLYQLYNQSDFKDHVIMHSCDIPLCCNIDHLSHGTASENTLDMVEKKRNVKGPYVGTAMLNENQVKEIRSKYPKQSTIELAKEYGVCKQTICNIINGITYINASIMNENYKPVNKPVHVKYGPVGSYFNLQFTVNESKVGETPNDL